MRRLCDSVVADGDGTVRYKAPGGDRQELEPNAELPVGVALDAREGTVNLRTAGCRGRVQAGVFGGGVFSVSQPRKACGRVDVYLRGGVTNGSVVVRDFKRHRNVVVGAGHSYLARAYRH